MSAWDHLWTMQPTVRQGNAARRDIASAFSGRGWPQELAGDDEESEDEDEDGRPRRTRQAPRAERPQSQPSPIAHSLLGPRERAESLAAETYARAKKSAQNVNEAWAKEMDRRVEQAREERRWRHLKDIEAMKLQAAYAQQPQYQPQADSDQPPRRSLVSTLSFGSDGTPYVDGPLIKKTLLS